MNRKQLSMSQDDLSDKSNWIFFKVSKNTCSLQELAATSAGKLPLVVSVEDVQYHQTDWVRLSSNEVVFLSHLEQRQRVLATTDDGTYYSFPIDYPLYFVLFKISSTSHSQTTKTQSGEEPIYYETDSIRLSLRDLIAKHSLPCCVAVDDNDVSFYSAEDNSPLRFCRLKLSHVYSEKYFVGSEIRNGKLSHEIIFLPTFLRVKVRLVQGFSQKKDRKQSWKSFMAECIAAATTIGNSNTTSPPIDIAQLKAIDVTKAIKNPEKLSTIEPNDCIKFTSTSIHIDHTYEELPIAKPPTPATAFVSTFKTGKKFGGSLCERSQDDSDICSDYDDTRTSSDMFGGFRSDSTRQPAVESSNATATAFSVQRPALVSPIPPHPSVPTLNKLPPLLPKSGERRPAPLTLPKSSGAAEVPRPPPPSATMDFSSARFDGLTVPAGRVRLGSGSLQAMTRNSLDQDSGYSTNPDIPLTTEITEEHDCDYSSIKDNVVVPQPPQPKAKDPKKQYASKTVPRVGHHMAGSAEITTSPARLRCESPYEQRPVPQPPSLIRPNAEQRQGIDAPAKPRSQSKSSLRGSTERLFEPGPRSPIGESPWSGIPDPPPVKSGPKVSRVSDRIVPAAPRLKKDETLTISGSGDLAQKACPPLPPPPVDAPQSSAGTEGGSDIPSSRRHVPRPKTGNQTKTLAKPRKRSPEAKPKSPSPPRNTPIPKPNADPTPSNSASNCADFDICSVTGTTAFQINLTSGLVAESTWSAADYEQTHRNSEMLETLASDYEPFCPKSPETPQPPKPKPTPPLPKCPASRPKEDRTATNAGAIESASDIPDQLNGLSCSQMADCLRLLNMDAYVDGFLENQIDGKLLLELDEAILTTDLKVSRLHARKLLVFAHQGWRP